ncbi:dephospho-CoA kinase [Rhizobium leguminosarum]
MLKIGLTGSIGMGKSTAAKLFADAGIPVNDSDAVVHDLYAGEAAPLVNAAFPGTMKDGAVDRHELGRQLALHPDGFKRLEAIVHPLVRKREREFLKRQRAHRRRHGIARYSIAFRNRRRGKSGYRRRRQH